MWVLFQDTVEFFFLKKKNESKLFGKIENGKKEKVLEWKNDIHQINYESYKQKFLAP